MTDRWEIIKDGLDLHVLPIDDIREHTENDGCDCGPEVLVYGAARVVIHKAFDFREVVENLKSGTLFGEATS